MRMLTDDDVPAETSSSSHANMIGILVFIAIITVATFYAVKTMRHRTAVVVIEGGDIEKSKAADTPAAASSTSSTE